MILALLLMVAVLLTIFALGWYVLAPLVEWVGQKIMALAIQGADYHHLVKSGQVQDRSH